MGYLRGLTALLLVTALTVAANGAENLMETVHTRYAQMLRTLDDITMTHEYLERDDRDKWMIVDKVDEWIMGNKWRRDRVWFDPYQTRSDREEFVPDQTRLDIERLEPGEVRTAVIYDSRITWVVTERTKGTTVQWVDEALQADPDMSIIDYSAPAEPYLRDLPPFGHEAGSDEIFGRPCIVAECGYGDKIAMPQDGEIRIHTVWLDRDDLSILRLRGFIYSLPEVWSYLPMNELGLDSAEILIENTALTTVSGHRFSLSLPTETVISVAGVEDQITTYWYNTDLTASIFEVHKKDHGGIYGSPVLQVSAGVAAKSDGPSKRHPRRDRLIDAPAPTPEQPSITPQSKYYPKPGQSHSYFPPKSDPAQKNPPAKSAPPPPPPSPPPSKDDNSRRQ